MLTELIHCTQQIGERHNKLIVLTGSRGIGKTKLLQELGNQLGIQLLNVSLELGLRLAGIPQADRGFLLNQILREIVDKKYKEGDLVLLDNIELLFEPSLQINPLDIIKRLAISKRVVVVWPGELRGNRFFYAEMTHPEYRDYDADGVIVFKV